MTSFFAEYGFSVLIFAPLIFAPMVIVILAGDFHRSNLKVANGRLYGKKRGSYKEILPEMIIAVREYMFVNAFLKIRTTGGNYKVDLLNRNYEDVVDYLKSNDLFTDVEKGLIYKVNKMLNKMYKKKADRRRLYSLTFVTGLFCFTISLSFLVRCRPGIFNVFEVTLLYWSVITMGIFLVTVACVVVHRLMVQKESRKTGQRVAIWRRSGLGLFCLFAIAVVTIFIFTCIDYYFPFPLKRPPRVYLLAAISWVGLSFCYYKCARIALAGGEFDGAGICDQ